MLDVVIDDGGLQELCGETRRIPEYKTMAHLVLVSTFHPYRSRNGTSLS